VYFTSEWLSFSFERMHFFSEEVLLLHECGFYTIERVSLAGERMSLAFERMSVASERMLVVIEKSCLNYEREASKARRDLPQGLQFEVFHLRIPFYLFKRINALCLFGVFINH